MVIKLETNWDKWEKCYIEDMMEIVNTSTMIETSKSEDKETMKEQEERRGEREDQFWRGWKGILGARSPMDQRENKAPKIVMRLAFPPNKVLFLQ